MFLGKSPVADRVHSHCQPHSPSLNWSSLQTLLETAVPHVLIILDCCFAANAARDTTEGTTKEILAACSRESPTHGVGQRSFTSALIEEMQAFDGRPFTTAMLHSRLVTMRWRLAFTPIYALLSERGGNSVTICPFSDGGASARPESDCLAELEATENSQDGQTSISLDTSSSSPTRQKQTLDTRVLLTVSVVQDTLHDVSHWVSWLTTAAPWDVTKVDVQVHSVFKSYSTLVVVSVPTTAWDRLPERPAYRFIGFIRSGDQLQAGKPSITSITETVPTREPLPLIPPSRERLPSSISSIATAQSQVSQPPTPPFGVNEKESPTPNTMQPSSSVHIHPTNEQNQLESNAEARSISQRHKRQRTDFVAQPSAKAPRRSPRFSVSETSASPPRTALDRERTPEPGSNSQQYMLGWSPEMDELLMQSRQQGLNWQYIASQYFPLKTANSCRKRHERLIEERKDAEKTNSIDIEKLTKNYLDVREEMWKLVADRVGEKWQIVEAKVSYISLPFNHKPYIHNGFTVHGTRSWDTSDIRSHSLTA